MYLVLVAEDPSSAPLAERMWVKLGGVREARRAFPIFCLTVGGSRIEKEEEVRKGEWGPGKELSIARLARRFQLFLRRDPQVPYPPSR